MLETGDAYNPNTIEITANDSDDTLNHLSQLIELAQRSGASRKFDFSLNVQLSSQPLDGRFLRSEYTGINVFEDQKRHDFQAVLGSSLVFDKAENESLNRGFYNQTRINSLFTILERMEFAGLTVIQGSNIETIFFIPINAAYGFSINLGFKDREAKTLAEQSFFYFLNQEIQEFNTEIFLKLQTTNDEDGVPFITSDKELFKQYFKDFTSVYSKVLRALYMEKGLSVPQYKFNLSINNNTIETEALDTLKRYLNGSPMSFDQVEEAIKLSRNIRRICKGSTR